MAGKLYFIIGLPRSGKSTFAKKWMKEESGRVVVNADCIRLNLYGQRFCGVGEPFVQATKDVMIRSLLDYGHDVLVDGTHTTIDSIEKMIEIDRYVTAICLSTHIEECKHRAIDANQADLLPIIDRMHKQLTSLPHLVDDIGLRTVIYPYVGINSSP